MNDVEYWLSIIRNYDPLSREPNKDEKALFKFMSHCVGMDRDTESKAKHFFPYRNYYDAGEVDIPVWDALTASGWAVKDGSYRLTPLGLNMLSLMSGKTVWSEDARFDTDTKIAVFAHMCKVENAACYGSWFPISARSMSSALVIPYGRVLKACHALEAEGLIKKTYDGGIGEDRAYCIHGFVLTPEGRETPTWKRAHEVANAEINEMLKGN